MTAANQIAVVAIGRNEGQRLIDCLASIGDKAWPIVYVDSGSTDGSVEAAKAVGADVVTLDLSKPFTAARARNAGYARVRELVPDAGYVQFLDGDCDLVGTWLDLGREALEADPGIAVVCGRRREKFPDATFWNKLTDAEWEAPSGFVRACGGDALMRRAAFDAVNGYREDLIAGEEPEMCFRMREAGWTILRLNAEMTRHDAAMTRAGQWWQRCRRAGHTYAEGVAMHGSSPEKYRVRELSRTILWGILLPLIIVLAAVLWSPAVLFGILIYPIQIVRLSLKGEPLSFATCLVLGKFAEAQGALGYWLWQRRTLIEYK